MLIHKHIWQIVSDPNNTTNSEFKCGLQAIKKSIGVDLKKWCKMAAVVKGVREETTTDVHRRHWHFEADAGHHDRPPQ